MSPALRSRLAITGIGIALIGTGATIVGVSLINHANSVAAVNARGAVDSNALSAWNDGGNSAVKGASAKEAAVTTGACSPGAAPASSYALVSFTGLPQYNYAGVAGDGTWDLLHQRSMVHYTGTPAPGQKGNVIIAFHREPNYEHIDQLGKGETISIQDRQCNTFVYQITSTGVYNPNDVTQLNPTDGYDLTMITCTPFWQDYDRIVWRASLISENGKPFTAA